MCQALFVDGRELTNMAELRELVGYRSIVFKPGYTPLTNCCLCPVDLGATATKAGFKVVRDPAHDIWGVTWAR